MLDLLIRNGKIVDGTGNPWFYGDVAIKDGIIVEVGYIDQQTEARNIIDLQRQLVVSPGFIDGHCHSDLMILENPDCEIKLKQGVTSEVVGNCGLAPAPSSGATSAMLRQYVEPVLGRSGHNWPWTTVGQYLDAVAEARPSGNLCTYAAHGALRTAVMGFDQRHAGSGERQLLNELLDMSLQEGAIGLSLGLIYAPGRFADRAELSGLCEVLARRNGLLSAHIRGEGANLLEAIGEVIDLAESSGVALQISHLKAAGSANWGKVTAALELIEGARSRGVDVTCDVYPYTAGATTLTTLLPPWVLVGGVSQAMERLRDKILRKQIIADMQRSHGDWDNLVIASGWQHVFISSVQTAANKKLEGKHILELSQLRGGGPEECVMDLLLEESGDVSIVFFLMDDREVDQVIRWDGSIIASDSLHCQTEKPHPRLFGCFPRLLGRSVREQRLLSLEQAVRKITSFPAKRFKLHARGLLHPGYIADITIFDPKTITDRSTYTAPMEFPEGIHHVFVRGEATIFHGHHTGAKCGCVMR